MSFPPIGFVEEVKIFVEDWSLFIALNSCQGGNCYSWCPEFLIRGP